MIQIDRLIKYFLSYSTSNLLSIFYQGSNLLSIPGNILISKYKNLLCEKILHKLIPADGFLFIPFQRNNFKKVIFQ